MDIYRSREDIRLDERQLAQHFGISRTPVREAMAQLEREGFVRSVPRRGIYVVRKTKREVIEMITAWAALESMAARLITAECRRRRDRDAAQDVRDLRGRRSCSAKLDEYSEVNIEFHQTIIRMSGNGVLIDLAENLFTHMRMIRRKTIGEQDRADRSIRDHMNIIEALEARDTDARRGPCSQPRARPRRARGQIRRLSGLKDETRQCRILRTVIPCGRGCRANEVSEVGEGAMSVPLTRSSASARTTLSHKGEGDLRRGLCADEQVRRNTHG